MELLVLIGGAALPSLLLVGWIGWRDRGRPEPFRLISMAVLLGFLGTLPVLLAGFFVGIPEVLLSASLLGAFWSAFISAALLEESVKFFIIKRFFYHNPAFDTIMDGILYAMCVSLGFAFAENILYGMDGTGVLFLRAFTAVPLHASATGIMGYWLGQAKLGRQRQAAAVLQRKAWISAVLIHGAYNFLLLLGGLAAYAALLVLAAAIAILLKLIKKAQAADSLHTVLASGSS
ncbi:MAG: PrsW family intramembrane metalloprotease [Spirochaetes bacterium]|nr:PrsW family intramembrane metalloprotease [Spirochaetota bacterium]